MTESKKKFQPGGGAGGGGGGGGRVEKEGIVVLRQALELAGLWCTGYRRSARG